MTVEGMINVCQAVTHGSLRQVKNLKTMEHGTVITGAGNELTVQVGQVTETWHYADCEEYNTG